MAQWDQDKFMSQWATKYVSTNVKPGSKPYDKDLFFELTSTLVSSEPKLEDVAYTLIVRRTSFFLLPHHCLLGPAHSQGRCVLCSWSGRCGRAAV
jgi:hypothetical protein